LFHDRSTSTTTLLSLGSSLHHCSIEFDPCGLTMRHLTTRVVLARCDNFDPLYSIRFLAPPPSSCVAPPFALAAATTVSTWHRRLGHLNHGILSRLSSTSAIPYPRGHAASPCLSAWFTFAYFSSLPCPATLTPLISSSVTFGPPRYQASLVTSTIY
jgi:hypothetical protein